MCNVEIKLLIWKVDEGDWQATFPLHIHLYFGKYSFNTTQNLFFFK